MPHRHINNAKDAADFVRLIGSLNPPFTVEWSMGRDRSLDQNRLQFLWAREASEQRGDLTVEEVRCEWKLHHGVPIMREESEEFRQLYDAAIKPLPYEMKLKAMKLMPVTSDMKVRQMVRYLDAVAGECAQLGIRLTDPDPDLAAYQARYRSEPYQEKAA